MRRRRVTVIGGGNGSFAAAVDATEAGHEVRWWRRDEASFAPVREAGGVQVIDHAGERRVPVATTANLAEALEGAELILAPIPASGQGELARALAPHLAQDQVIFLPPGTFGSVAMARIIRDEGCEADVVIAETGTLPWLCRKTDETSVRITTRASRLPVGAFPARLQPRALEIVGDVFPGAVEPVEDALSAALMNAGPIIHPPLILMNAGPIQHFDRWDIHNEGTQPAVRAVHDALDAERVAVREALGYAPPHFPLRDHYETSDWMYGNLAHDKLVDSGDWHEHLDLQTHRYMTEDIAYGLAFLVSVGEWAGVRTPVASGLLALAGAVKGADLRAGPRTLEALGLDAHQPASLRRYLHEGERAVEDMGER